MDKIDYTKLNDRIVQQVYRYAFLDETEYRALIEAKIARTQALIDARVAVARTRTER